MRPRFLFVALLSVYVIPLGLAQDQSSSPPARTQCKFLDGKDVTVDYFSPRMNGRKIFGDSVPYGQVWQTGANKPTTFVTSTNLMVGGKNVPAGNYTILTIPYSDKWTLIVNKRTGKLDFPYAYQSSELVRIDLTVRPLTSPIENFTITFDQRRGGCVLNLQWENTEASALIAETK
jgi:hypothetical protein